MIDISTEYQEVNKAILQEVEASSNRSNGAVYKDSPIENICDIDNSYGYDDYDLDELTEDVIYGYYYDVVIHSNEGEDILLNIFSDMDEQELTDLFKEDGKLISVYDMGEERVDYLINMGIDFESFFYEDVI